MTQFPSVAISELPLWGQVALAARYGRRIQSLFGTRWSDAPESRVHAIDAAIALAESAAASATFFPADSIAAASAAAADPAAADPAASAAASAVVSALQALSAASASGDASIKVNELAGYIFIYFDHYLVWLDYELVLRAAQDGQLTDKTPVPPEFFGPLWPFGEPAGGPEEVAAQIESQELCIEIEAPPGATDEEIQQLVAEAGSRANALHIAHGGCGLTVAEDADVQVWEPAPVPVGGPA